jgi:hypothetical protein
LVGVVATVTSQDTFPEAIGTTARLWDDDNPSATDLLGFDAVVAPVRVAISIAGSRPPHDRDPRAVGRGKSTVLGLIAADLKDDDAYVVVQTNPWEFDNQADVKGTLIAQVLQTLGERFEKTEGVTGKVQRLLSESAGLA